MSNELLPIAEAVATELGTDWSATAPHDYSATITDGTVALALHWHGYGDGKRVAIRPSYPAGARDVIRYDEHPHEQTTVARDRAPAQIAGQIRRTVLATAHEWTPIVLERLARQASALDKRRAACERIAAILPGSTASTDDVNAVRLWSGPAPWYGDVTLYHEADRAGLELHGVPTDVVLAILELLPREAAGTV